MDAADPLCAISSTALLLARTLGPGPAPASATGPSPSKARDPLLDAIAVARSLKGSEELVKQAKTVLKEHRDNQTLYHDDGIKARPPANGSKEQQGRRPALNRKRARFSMKDTSSEPMPLVDQSKLTNIQDPVEYFMALERLEEADEEIKRLNGVAEKRVLNFDPVDGPKRQPGLRGRKSVRSFKVLEDADTQDPIEVPASQATTMTGSQLSQDIMHAVGDKNEQCVPSSCGEAISGVSGKEDSLEKDGRDDLTYVLTSIQGVDESEEENYFRKILGLKEIRKERVSLRSSIPGVRSPSSNMEQKGSMRVHPPESQSRQDRISELEKHVFLQDTTNAKCTDDESEGSPDVVMDGPSLVHDASDVPMTDENFTGSEIDRETPNLGARAADHSLDPEQPDHAYERQPGGSSVGLCRGTEVAKETEACRSNISVEFELQEDNVPIDNPTVGKSTNETEASSHHLEGSSTEELVNKPGRHVAPDGIDRTLHAAVDSIQHQEMVKEGGVLQDKSSQSLEMPLEDIDPVNEPQMHGGSSKKLTPDLCNALSSTKQKKQQAAQQGKMKKQSKRGKKVADEPSHALKIAQANFDSENQPHNDDVNTEKQTVMSSTWSPNGAKGQKGAQRRNKTQKLNQRKTLGDAGLGVRRSSRTRSRPLDYWLGERLLYGPISDNLPAVIGVKAYSPDQDGKRTLKVKSFLPEQYKVLIDTSAKY